MAFFERRSFQIHFHTCLGLISLERNYHVFYLKIIVSFQFGQKCQELNQGSRLQYNH